jgi:hypothetical protein
MERSDDGDEADKERGAAERRLEGCEHSVVDKRRKVMSESLREMLSSVS